MGRSSVLALSLAVLGLAPAASTAQGTAGIRGTVLDSVSRAPVAQATVAVIPGDRRTTTDARGRFALAGLATGEVRVIVTRAGFARATRDVTLRADATVEIDVTMRRLAFELEAARSEAVAIERERFETQADVGTVTLSARQISALPRVAEADPIRAASLLPGVVGRNDFSTGFSVRGGESNQNLVSLDGYPVYNPFHFGGMFSTFIDAAVGDVTLHTSGLPARHGGRLSGMLDVQSAEESRPGTHGKVDVSMLAASASASGRSTWRAATWRVAARRTFADRLASVIGTDPVPYHFSDLHAHARLGGDGRPRFAVTAYQGLDRLDASFATYGEGSPRTADGGSTLDEWGNRVLGATASIPLRTRVAVLGPDSAVLLARASHSTFRSLLDRGDGTSVYRNRLEDARASVLVEGHGPRHRRELGLEVSALDIAWAVEEGQGSIESRRRVERSRIASAFVSDQWRPVPSLLLDLGVRVDDVAAADWVGASPRIAAKYFVSPDAALMLSAGRSAQWTHSLALEDDPVRSFEAWRASGGGRPVSTARYVVGGHERWFGGRRFVRVEAFYKWYASLLEPDLTANPAARTDAFVSADGRSWGADLMLRQLDGGAVTGWIAYTYAVSLRWQDSVRYRPAHDRRHDANAVLIWRAGDWIVSGRLGYGSPMPYTELTAVVPRRFWDPVSGMWGGGERRVRYEGIGGARNGNTLPATHRLDLGAERRFEFRRFDLGLVASVVNVTNAPNVLTYTYDYTASPARRYPVRQLPILPSLGVSIAF